MKLRTKSLGLLGVEVEGLDLRQSIDEENWFALRELVMAEGVVVFRDQPMESGDQVELGRRFGELENTSPDQQPLEESDFLLSNVGEDGSVRSDTDVMMQLVAINEGWHTDSSFRDVPASFSLFSALTVPAKGGDTFFASLRLGWESLTAAEQVSLYGLRARHDYHRAYVSRNVDMTSVFDGEAPTAVHPIVRMHPETGQAALYLTQHMYEVEGMDSEASERLIHHLLEACVASERIYRHAWSPGDLLIWDNRSMLHRAQGFDAVFPRIMRHVRVAGEGPAIAAVR
jgi:alpha-ketoglutarate-dependent taurine dioxygenase